jgi:hypothetical protein
MTKKNSKILSLSKEENAEAQRKLDALCATVGMSSWDIGKGRGKAKWKSLVFALCGIQVDPPKKAGRPYVNAKRDNSIYQQVLIDEKFSPTKTQVKGSIHKVAERFGLENGQVRGVRNRVKKQQDKIIDELAQNPDLDFPLGEESQESKK